MLWRREIIITIGFEGKGLSIFTAMDPQWLLLINICDGDAEKFPAQPNKMITSHDTQHMVFHIRFSFSPIFPHTEKLSVPNPTMIRFVKWLHILIGCSLFKLVTTSPIADLSFVGIFLVSLSTTPKAYYSKGFKSEELVGKFFNQPFLDLIGCAWVSRVLLVHVRRTTSYFLGNTSDCWLGHIDLISNDLHWFFGFLVGDRLNLLDELDIHNNVWPSILFSFGRWRYILTRGREIFSHLKHGLSGDI